ncbi:extracellular matrix protein 1 isoform X2 [Hyperolius riggenbachi]|uniref:extracellular matrix protein 1 isoform X2 n=1 Tax=Hyperolius riggenbachi TaxID=752182 RepID=UPI0035A3CE7B
MRQYSVVWILAVWIHSLCFLHADVQVPAEDDFDMAQKEVELSFPLDMSQREVQLAFPVAQREVDLPLLIQGVPMLTPRGRKPSPSLPSNNLNNFPPGRPSQDNIGNICRKHRPVVKYGAHNLPQSGFSHLGRQGNAINSLEEGYARCCRQSDKLRCAVEVWQTTMDNFCKNEFTVKTRHFHCCKEKGLARETCFSSAAPNPNYVNSSPSQEIGSADISSLGSPRSFRPCGHNGKCLDTPDSKFRLSDLAFPPGEPKSSNIQNICKLRKYRPLYSENTLPKSGFGPYVRRAKAIYQAEAEFKKCCKKEDVPCAHSGWQKALSNFCTRELVVKTKHYECCKKKDQVTMFHCFASEAPFPEYDKEVENLNLSNVTEDILDKMCGDSKLITKQKQIPLLVSGLKDSCCSLPQDKKLICVQEQKDKFMKTMCGPKKDSWKDTHNCCIKEDLEERAECFNSYLQSISMAISQRMKME